MQRIKGDNIEILHGGNKFEMDDFEFDALDDIRVEIARWLLTGIEQDTQELIILGHQDWSAKWKVHTT